MATSAAAMMSCCPALSRLRLAWLRIAARRYFSRFSS
jgi:hypothetical protein